MPDPELRTVALAICQPCLDGEGSECHTPGCALWMHKVDLPIDPVWYRDLEQVAWGRPNPHKPRLGGPHWRMRGLYENDDPGDGWDPVYRLAAGSPEAHDAR